jgi:hypothetical protein
LIALALGEVWSFFFKLRLGLGLFCWIFAFLFSNRLPGGGITFFAAAKKVIKESSFSTTPKACLR